MVWLAGGLLLYVAYRVSQGKPLFKRISVPEASLTRSGEPEAPRPHRAVTAPPHL